MNVRLADQVFVEQRTYRNIITELKAEPAQSVSKSKFPKAYTVLSGCALREPQCGGLMKTHTREVLQ